MSTSRGRSGAWFLALTGAFGGVSVAVAAPEGRSVVDTRKFVLAEGGAETVPPGQCTGDDARPVAWTVQSAPDHVVLRCPVPNPGLAAQVVVPLTADAGIARSSTGWSRAERVSPGCPEVEGTWSSMATGREARTAPRLRVEGASFAWGVASGDVHAVVGGSVPAVWMDRLRYELHRNSAGDFLIPDAGGSSVPSVGRGFARPADPARSTAEIGGTWAWENVRVDLAAKSCAVREGGAVRATPCAVDRQAPDRVAVDVAGVKLQLYLGDTTGFATRVWPARARGEEPLTLLHPIERTSEATLPEALLGEWRSVRPEAGELARLVVGPSELRATDTEGDESVGPWSALARSHPGDHWIDGPTGVSRLAPLPGGALLLCDREQRACGVLTRDGRPAPGGLNLDP